MDKVKETSTKGLIEIVDIGLQPYDRVLALQRLLFTKIKEGQSGHILLLCSHPPVITIGKSGDTSHIRASEELLKMDGIEIFFVERGGDTTYHSNEQLVCYPLLNLNNIRRDVGWYVRTIEEVIIRTLDDYSIVGSRIANLPGVWINHKRATDEDKLGKKIGSVGVKLSKWCTMHGFSLNVRNVQKGFALIEPCGMPNIKVTSLEEELGYTVEINEVSSKIVHHFLELFNLEGNYSA